MKLTTSEQKQEIQDNLILWGLENGLCQRLDEEGEQRPAEADSLKSRCWVLARRLSQHWGSGRNSVMCLSKGISPLSFSNCHPTPVSSPNIGPRAENEERWIRKLEIGVGANRRHLRVGETEHSWIRQDVRVSHQGYLTATDLGGNYPRLFQP